MPVLFTAVLDKYHIGSISNLERRLSKHSANHEGFVGKAGDWGCSFIGKAA